MTPDTKQKVVITPQDDDPYRSIRRHIRAALVLLLVVLVVSAIWLASPIGM